MHYCYQRSIWLFTRLHFPSDSELRQPGAIWASSQHLTSQPSDFTNSSSKGVSGQVLPGIKMSYLYSPCKPKFSAVAKFTLCAIRFSISGLTSLLLLAIVSTFCHNLIFVRFTRPSFQFLVLKSALIKKDIDGWAVRRHYDAHGIIINTVDRPNWPPTTD